MNTWRIRLFHWEYWSFAMLYLWIYPVWFFLSLRARSFFFFSASNPAIKNGGFLNESKKEIYAIMPSVLYPPTIHFDAGTKEDTVLKRLKENGFDFPLIGKPDAGGRGRGVKKLESVEEVIAYTRNVFVSFHIQKFVPYPNEAGIFYYRYPGEPRGRLSGIVRKEFLTVTGDGYTAIEGLLKKDNRAILQMSSLKKMHGAYLSAVLQKGEQKILVPYGNHARGAKFLDDSSLIDDQLTEVIEGVCSSIKDFYYGRLDIRYNKWEELRAGKNFSVIEVNGAGSEPTHMYDPKHSVFFAWKEIIRHWIILCKISRMNHKKGHPYLSVQEGLAMFREDKLHSRMLAEMPE